MVVSSGGGQGVIISLKAADSFAATQYYPVKITADHTVGTCSATTDRCIGIAQNDAAQNAQLEVLLLGCGVSKVMTDGTIAAGADCYLAATGGVRAALSADALRSVIVGKALEASGASGDIISILLTPPNIGTTS